MVVPESSETRTWRMTPDLLGFVNQEGRFVETNPAWQTVLGWSVEEIRSMIFIDFLHPDDVARTIALFESMKQGGAALHFENRYRCKDGSYRWLSWVAVEEGDMFFCSARDITADKERSRALKTQEDQALLREQFVAILSHDLRNPLAAIGSAVRIASRDGPDERVSEMLASITSSADRMAKLIDTTLDFARARLGEGIPIHKEPALDLAAGLEQVVDEIRLAHPARNIQFTCNLPETVVCDPTRIKQLLSNLLGNAVTHGSRSRPIIVEAQSSKDRFELYVTNSGKSIPDSHRATIFEPFSRGKEDTSLQGLGLGLYISDQIAKSHDGSLSVDSDTDRTVFSLSIPA